jgi:dTDP-4-dehydrorhamnose 3,5-epimerase
VPSTMTYMVDRYYDTNDELGVAWDDPELSIPWPVVGAPLLSPRDEKNPRVAGLDPTRLPP